MPQARNQPLLNYFPDEDGYTLSAYIAGVPRLHGPVRVRYRPTEQLERAVLLEVNQNHSEKEVTKKFAAVMASKLSEWDVEQLGPSEVMIPMPITPENMLRLKPALWIRLINIMLWGADGGDVDPDLNIEEIKKQVDADYEAILKGDKIGDARLDAERKN